MSSVFFFFGWLRCFKVAHFSDYDGNSTSKFTFFKLLNFITTVQGNNGVVEQEKYISVLLSNKTVLACGMWHFEILKKSAFLVW